MAIVLVRIDDRLVHGQIVQGWLKNIAVDKIAVASDFVANDNMQKILMSLSVPNNVSLDIKTVEEITQSIINGEYEKLRTMIIAAKPEEILYMVDKGANFKQVNVGGMHYAQDKKQVLKNVFVDDKDIEVLKILFQKGIELEGRILPLDERINVMEAIGKSFYKK
ncbi:MAG: PTS sugar transporter subunit IIB [Elusimicrobiota bacterium]|jgi:mannose/fructose/N-acetylgalactosamine-specific phosphotransferase system component IIB|nr:PTS sugar transporter subunit IIB [Elusimicrobiota bacterium]